MSETLERVQVRQAVPFFMVTDMKSSLEFYRAGLGFEITLDWRPQGEIRWCRLERGDVSLMLQQFAPGGRPVGALGQGLSVVFMCDDAVAVWRELRGRGVQASRPFVGNGLWVTQTTDPDGYRLVFESPTDAPEETEYDGD